MLRHSKFLIPQKSRFGLTPLSLLAPCSAMSPMTEQPIQTGKLLSTAHMGKKYFIMLHKVEPVTSATAAVDVVAVPPLSCNQTRSQRY